MVIFEKQRIPTAEKNKVWRRNNVDSICARVDEFGDDWVRMWHNYRLKNNQLNQEEYREYCDTLGLDKTEGRRFVEPFNMTHNVIEVLKGEEANMPWTYGVVNLSPNATNEILRMKQREIMQYIDERLALEIEKVQYVNQLTYNQQGVNNANMLNEESKQQQLDAFMKKMQEREANLMKPADIEKKYSKYKSLKERTAHKLLQAMSVKNNLKWVKNQTFEDALVAGLEVVEVVVDEYTGMPSVRQLNPLNVFFHKSSDSPFVQDSDYVGYKEEITYADAIDQFGDLLDDKDLERLKTWNSRVFGTGQPFHSFEGKSVDHWDHLKQYEHTYQHPMSTIPSYGTTNVISDGLYATDKYRYKYENYCVKYTVYWRSQRRVGKLEFTDEYGNLQSTIVDESFVVPIDATKRTEKRVFGKSRVYWEWTDESGYNRLEWIWIPEVWKGVRLNGDIHVSAEPYENAYKSMLNPYRTKLPVYGFMYSNRNAFCVSTMDRMKPWQKLFYVIMSKWLKLITQDKGVIKLLNVLMMDKELGYERSLQLAVDQGVLPFNPLAHSNGLGTAYSQKPAEALDLSNADQLAHYTELLQFVYAQLKLAAGITDQRLAQTSTSTNVTDNQRDMMQSMNITNSVFAAHDLLWQEVLQGLCESAVKVLDDKQGFFRGILSDEEFALINLDMISLEDEYSVRVGDNSRAFKMLGEAKQLAHALVQNDKIKFSTLLDLLDNDNLAEFKDELKGIEKELEEREMKITQQQQAHEKEMQDVLVAEQEKARQQRMAEISLKGDYDLESAKIKAMSWDEDHDRNDNNVPDVLELDKFKAGMRDSSEKLEIAKQKLDLDKRKLDQRDRELDGHDLQRVSDQKLREQELEIKKKVANKPTSKK